MIAKRHTFVSRSLRRLTLGSGPLERRTDRLQAIGRLVVVLSMLAAPLLAVVASAATTAHLQAVAAAEASDRSPTHAVLLEVAPEPTPPSGATVNAVPSTGVPVRAAWSLPGGVTREGFVSARPHTPIGATVPVWVDGEGDLTSAPLDRSSIPNRAAAAGLLPLIGLPLATWTLYVALTRALDASRERAWEEEWTAVEPDWNSRLL
ncbi:Rv1733c family protein [Geodermatophilus sabuli]|uniref:Transmembrane protein n=1 Tax=Geodermatophilus sabuli TaxID=1564158 RepID=A0A285EEB6_9ACTN|nr:hypothetical protein [Geodermatophilus sabuli]MBB3084465.1 hypothetical protein [Geodermatophilus sabuli]SNX97340.1 hypothetical protein SAMN06893097_106290 [Geodermatophilus sabuli]